MTHTLFKMCMNVCCTHRSKIENMLIWNAREHLSHWALATMIDIIHMCITLVLTHGRGSRIRIKLIKGLKGEYIMIGYWPTHCSNAKYEIRTTSSHRQLYSQILRVSFWTPYFNHIEASINPVWFIICQQKKLCFQAFQHGVAGTIVLTLICVFRFLYLAAKWPYWLHIDNCAALFYFLSSLYYYIY